MTVGTMYISRETLQQNTIWQAIEKNQVYKCLEMVAGIAGRKGEYKEFYEMFGLPLRLGAHEDPTDRTKIIEMPRFYTSKPGDEQIRLKEHADLERGSGTIITADSPFPFLVIPRHSTLDGDGDQRKKGQKVKYMVNPVDEHVAKQLKEFDTKRLKSTAKEGLKKNEDEVGNKMLEKLKAEVGPFTKLAEELGQRHAYSID